MISALLAADLLGLMPNPRSAALDGRRALCETLAINCSLLATDNKLRMVKANLEATVDRNPEILSAALRRPDGQLIVEVGDHDVHWRRAFDGASDVNNIFVPITAGQKPWGVVEVRFAPLDKRVLFGTFDRTTAIYVGFAASVCLLLFSMFLGKALAQLDPSKVVPARVRAALDALAEGLLVMDNRNRIVLANQAFAHTVGTTPEALQGRSASRLPWSRHRDTPDLRELPWEAAGREKASKSGVPLLLRTKSGDDRTFMVNAAPIASSDGKPRGVLASFDDVTTLEAKRFELMDMLRDLQNSRREIQQQNRELQILATRDPLTDCLNRRAFFDEFEKQWAAANRYDNVLSCVIVDIDHFKAINDKHGHSVGDMVLKKVAGTLREAARDTDLVCRYGGEEFCILMPQTDSEAAYQGAERLRTMISDLKFFDFSITASLGVSARSQGASDLQRLLDQADRALYEAKNSGRNTSMLWDASMDNMPMGTGSKTARRVDSPVGDAPIPFHAVTGLLSALAYRDAETAAHSTRVADLCVATARNLLSASDTYVLEMAALLHDIGKIGVPDSILFKPGPLTEDEWKEMSVHDRIGVEILRSSFASPALAEIVDTHHAFYGGKARKEDLPTGDDISTEARILAIADAYDAMVSDRVYRKGRSPAEAFAELRRCAGTQFDPQLVERFIAMVHQRNATAKKDVHATSKEVALRIGIQIEQIVRALDQSDYGGLALLAGELKAAAADADLKDIGNAAAELEAFATDDQDLKKLVSLTHELLDLCRSTQKAYIDVCSRQDEDEDSAESAQARPAAMS
jgi:diguanylate cyclase (GGDEF)-like protein/PAS domain S-box-containing protein/putative nucleotidyltransferase with HDIG domain